MAYDQAKVEAYAAMDEAIEKLRAAYDYDDMLTGWVLITASVRYKEPCDDPNCDEMDLESAGGLYSKRGLDPTLISGMLHDAMRHTDFVATQGYSDGPD